MRFWKIYRRIFSVLAGLVLGSGVLLADAGKDPVKIHSTREATFAGGCFWCMESCFDSLPGVLSTTPGYTGGALINPTYEQVSTGKTGHVEAVRVLYDSSKISYEQLLDVFWKNIDPTTLNRQFADVGTQYRTAIFYHDDEQKKQAAASKEKLQASGLYPKPLVTEIVPASEFYPAEEYHQDYYRKSRVSYQRYRSASGRDAYLKKIWGSEPSH